MVEEQKITKEEVLKIDKDTAKRKKILFKKYKSFLSKKYEMSDFDEPVAILLRRSLKAEFYEGAKKSTFDFIHSDGEKREIMMNPKKMITFEYGKGRYFRGYVIHEDFPEPLPEHPLITSEMMGIAVEKTLNDTKKWKIGEIKAKGEFYWKIFAGLGLLMLLYILYKMVVNPTPPTIILQQAGNITQAIVNNASAVVDTGIVPIN